jgi:hypothetical protein
LRQEDYEFKARLSDIVRPCLKKTKEEKQKLILKGNPPRINWLITGRLDEGIRDKATVRKTSVLCFLQC